MPCGVPEEEWPYGSNIDVVNGLRFDPVTGKLWTRPTAPPLEQLSATANWVFDPGTFENNGGVRRISLFEARQTRGPNGTFDLTERRTISHTNTEATPQLVRAQVLFPPIAWFVPWMNAGCSVGLGGAVNGTAIQSQEHKPFGWNALPQGATSGTLTGPPGLFSWNPLVQGVPSTSFAGVYDSRAGTRYDRYPPYLTDLHGGWRTVDPGDSIDHTYYLFARAPGDQGWSTADFQYVYGFIDLGTPHWMRVEVLS